MPSFLQQQIQLYQSNSRVNLSAWPISKFTDTNLSKTTIRNVLLKINSSSPKEYSDEVVKDRFFQFIDQSLDCLCPLILTNQMILELSGGLQCQVILDTDFIGVYSSLILNDLFKISVELSSTTLPNLQHLKSLQSWHFTQSHIDTTTKWFEANLDIVLTHLKLNLFTERPRNLVLQGLRGSGKTTLIKYVCNRLVDDWNGMFWYINCQGFMNKTVDTIYEQLKMVYEEAIWAGPRPCLVVLEDIDLLIENKEQTIDPSSQLYHAQIVECNVFEHEFK